MPASFAPTDLSATGKSGTVLLVHGRRQRVCAFTVIELLAATAVFILMITLLLSAVSQVNGAWQTADSQKIRRERARIALDLIARDLQSAVVPMPGKNMTHPTTFLMNPADAGYKNDTIFWRTSLPTDRSISDIFAVGYFVDGENRLCRFQKNSAFTTFSLDQAVEGAKALQIREKEGFAGLLIEDVLELSVTLYNEGKGKDQTGAAQINPGETGTYQGTLPASAEVKLVLSDPRSMKRPNPPASANDQGVQVFAIRVDLPVVR